MTMNMGAVAALRRVKSAISVARYVLEHTRHSLLVGDLATQFALSMGFKEETLETNNSHNMWQQWMENDCQPNFWVVCNMMWISINFILGTNTVKYSYLYM
jgi:isoaspartyl peptidase/L-asparaginase-like protein (Ntn-hydrolase superfamily)